MSGPKPDALPLGDTPSIKNADYSKKIYICQGFFVKIEFKLTFLVFHAISRQIVKTKFDFDNVQTAR